MTWILLAITAHFGWAIVNVADKYFVVNRVKDPLAYLWWAIVLGSASFAIIPFIDFRLPPPTVLGWLMLGGALYFFGSLFYLQAADTEDITRINIWWGMIPVFTLGIGWITVGETLSPRELSAFAVLLAGAVVASVHAGKKIWQLSPAFWLMVYAALCYAAYGIILGTVTQSMSFLAAFIWLNITALCCALAMFAFPAFRRLFRHPRNRVDLKLGIAIFGIAVLDSSAVLLNVWALSLGPAALVFALEGFQVLFVFILAITISLFNPRLLRESLDKANIALKVIALVLLMAGIALLNL